MSGDITIDEYGPTHRLTADGWVQVPACNVRSGDRQPCALDEGHTGPHSWERPTDFSRLFTTRG